MSDPDIASLEEPACRPDGYMVTALFVVASVLSPDELIPLLSGL